MTHRCHRVTSVPNSFMDNDPSFFTRRFVDCESSKVSTPLTPIVIFPWLVVRRHRSVSSLSRSDKAIFWTPNRTRADWSLPFTTRADWANPGRKLTFPRRERIWIMPWKAWGKNTTMCPSTAKRVSDEDGMVCQEVNLPCLVFASRQMCLFIWRENYYTQRSTKCSERSGELIVDYPPDWYWFWHAN